MENIGISLALWLEKKKYIKDRDSSGLNQFKRTCVLDSLLAAIHTTYIICGTVKALLDSDEFFSNLLPLINDEKYTEARLRSLCKLGMDKRIKVEKGNVIDLYSCLYDYLPLFDTIVYETIENPEPLKDTDIYKETFSYCKALGSPGDPTFILGHSTNNVRVRVKDEKNRSFELQFLLLGKDDHMTMCFHVSEEKWLLYDNDANKPPIQPFDYESHKDYGISLAGYVKITEEQECKIGISETGDTVGAKPFKSDASSSSNLAQSEDMEVDTSHLHMPIPETGERLGTFPFK